MPETADWVDGFLFVANRPILDFVNTRPVLAQGAVELLPDFHALERWLIAAGIVRSPETRRLLRSWRQAPEAAQFLKEITAFREQLRDAVLRMERGAGPSEEFLQEVNTRLLEHPPATTLHRREGRVIRQSFFTPRRPMDLWTPFLDGAADLVSEPEVSRIRKCEACVVHFFDTSRKGSRRWCSMNICGNKVKVAAYQRRKRESAG
jgi:predicted RNA-binding Zn ribbon-like protein